MLDDDTPETLAARVFEAECEAYPEAIRLIAAAEWKSTDAAWRRDAKADAGNSRLVSAKSRTLTRGLTSLLGTPCASSRSST